LINNRQGGRRRGRGGGGPRPGGQPGGGNRQDNRQRGNAAQLLEKYKSLARDSQLAGDRVQTEYYLQFADHYYRVLNENRRFEEQRRPQNDYDDEDEGEELTAGAEGDEEQPQREPRREFDRDREPRRERHGRDGREPREQREPREVRAETGEPQREERNGQETMTRRLRPRRDRSERSEERPGAAASDEGGDERIPLDVLPPAIAPVGADEGEAKPRRRARRPRPDGEAEIAPAA
jgi:hypothetical protein